MTDLNLDGLGVALATPFKEDLSIDYDALEVLINHVIDGGCDYIVVLGTTAETPTLTGVEKQDLSKFIRYHNHGRVPLVLGIGGNNTAALVKEILSTDLNEYQAILSVTPYYNKPTQEGLFKHFMAIAEVSPLPLILYNVPGRTGVNISPDTVVRLVNSSDKFYGIKEASGQLPQCRELIHKSSKKFKIISGNDSDTVAIMQMGGNGVVSVLANALPSEMKKLVDLCVTKNFEEALTYQESLTPLMKYLFEDGNPAGVKALLWEKGLAKNILRLPLVPVSKTVEEKLFKSLP